MRREWADIVKGIAIVLVVLNHTGEGLASAGLAQRPPAWVMFHDLSFTFMVPVFFMLAGWFSQVSSKTLPQRARVLLTNLVYPYLLWSFLQAALMIITNAGNNGAAWRDLPGILLNGWMQFWFLHGLILLMLTDWVFRAMRTSPEIRLAFAVLLMSMTIYGFPWPWVLGRLSANIIYFEAGVFLATMNLAIARLRTLLLLAGMGGLLLVTLQTHGAGYQTPLRPFAALAGIAACCAVSRMISLRGNPVSKLLQTAGKYSLQIYVLHSILSASVRVVLTKFGIGNVPLHFLLGTAAAFAGTAVVVKLDNRFLRMCFRFPLKSAIQRLRSIFNGTDRLTPATG